jgi:hypothetical protein
VSGLDSGALAVGPDGDAGASSGAGVAPPRRPGLISGLGLSKPAMWPPFFIGKRFCFRRKRSKGV